MRVQPQQHIVYEQLAGAFGFLQRLHDQALRLLEDRILCLPALGRSQRSNLACSGLLRDLIKRGARTVEHQLVERLRNLRAGIGGQAQGKSRGARGAISRHELTIEPEIMGRMLAELIQDDKGVFRRHDHLYAVPNDLWCEPRQADSRFSRRCDERAAAIGKARRIRLTSTRVRNAHVFLRKGMSNAEERSVITIGHQ